MANDLSLSAIHAWHEAGHAVMFVACGFDLESVTLAPPKAVRRDFTRAEEASIWADEPEIFQRIILTALGGEAGERLLHEHVRAEGLVPRGGRTDRGQAFDALKDLKTRHVMFAMECYAHLAGEFLTSRAQFVRVLASSLLSSSEFNAAQIAALNSGVTMLSSAELERLRSLLVLSS